MEHNKYPPKNNDTPASVYAFRAGQAMLVHVTNAMNNGRPERNFDPNFDPGEVPLLALGMMDEARGRIEQELGDDYILHEIEPQFGDE